MTAKLYNRGELVQELARQREKGLRIVFTNGCFDLLHIGHTRYLQTARALGDLLVVGINSDASVHALDKEGQRPIVPGGQRAELLAALSCVDYVVMFDEPDPGEIIAALQPDILVKGGDWAPDQIIGREVVERRGGQVQTIPLVPGISTTALLRKIRGTNLE